MRTIQSTWIPGRTRKRAAGPLPALSSSVTNSLTPEERVRAAAARYDDTGTLAERALAALARRVRTSGKVCTRCGLTKPLTAFGPDLRKHDGLDPRCRACINRYRQQRPRA